MGVGRMGNPMALNLLRAHHDLVVFKRNGELSDELLRSGAERARRLRDLGSSGISISMVPDGPATHEVLFGEGGIASHAAEGHIHIAMGTIGPTAARQLGAKCAEVGLRFADAPVSGSTALAATAQLSSMVGASRSVFAEIQPILSVMTRSQVLAGDVGAGSVLKLSIQSALAATNLAMAESLNFAELLGVPRTVAIEVLASSVASTPYFQYKRQWYENPSTEAVACPITTFEKDLDLVSAAAASAGAFMPQFEVGRTAFAEASDLGYGGDDMCRVDQVIRLRSGHVDD